MQRHCCKIDKKHIYQRFINAFLFVPKRVFCDFQDFDFAMHNAPNYCRLTLRFDFNKTLECLSTTPMQSGMRVRLFLHGAIML